MRFQCLLPFAALFLTSAPGAAASDDGAVTVVELFTSQGCSSCPPANANLAVLAATRPDVIPLSFGVTYWDRLGWKDTFASPQFTQRQYRYAESLGRPNVATPEMVVNGRVDLVGNRAGDVSAAIAKAGRLAGPEIAQDGRTLTIAKGSAGAKGAYVWLVCYDPRAIPVPVRAGENGGRTLPHRNVVRSLVRLGGWTGQPARFTLPAPNLALKAVVLVQTSGVGPILAARRIDGA